MRRVLSMAVLATMLGGCGDDEPADDTFAVVASFYPIAEAVSRVSGEAVEVTNLTPPGTEPHDIELTPDQVDDVEDADLVLYLGGGFQPAVEAVAERRSGTTVDLLAELPLDPGGDEVDPHFWLDPALMIEAVDVVEKALAETRQGVAPGAGEYRDELEALDRDFAAGLESCARRQFVTSHAAFHYLARRYGLEQVAIAGLSPEAEPDADRLSELTDVIERGGLTTVFYETLASPDVAEALAREAGVDTAVLDPVESLSEEDLDAGAGYADVMRRNLAALRRALDCR